MVISLLVLVLGISIPIMGGMDAERDLRQAGTKVQQQAREARFLAMETGQKRDLYFTRSSCFLGPLPRGQGERYELSAELERQLLKGVDITREDQEEIESVADPALPRIALPAELEFRIYSTERKRWLPVQLWRWRFNPNGLCEPLTVRVARGDSFLEMKFSPLTARLDDESLLIP